jgi:signal transduction histidine kinase
VIDVADDGPGLPEALREIVFERFHKGTAASPGAGLGLAIVRRVARMHQGEVGFLPGPGCRIRVSLPAALKPVTRSQPPATR